MRRALFSLFVLVAALAAWFWLPLGGDLLPELEVLLKRAEGLDAVGDHEQSAELFGRVAELADAAGDERRAVAARAQRAVCLKMLGRTSESRALLEPALARARALGDARTEGLALGNLARVESMEGNIELALDYLDELVALTQAQGDERTEILSREQAAVVVERLGRPAEALERFEAALARQAVLDLGEDDRTDALQRQKAWAQVLVGDDLGARESWSRAEVSAAALANQARQFSLAGRHAEGAETALVAAQTYDKEGGGQQAGRDRALELSLSELLRSGQHAACEQELATVLEHVQSDGLRAALDLIAARLALATGKPNEAAERARAARLGFGEHERAQEAGWIEAVSLVKSARPDEGLELLHTLPDSWARTILLGWMYALEAPESSLALEALPRLDPDAGFAHDGTLRTLRDTCPEPLPSLAWLTLHLALSDADRIRGNGQAAVADARVDDGLVDALRWQAAEARARLTGRTLDASAAALDIEPRLRRWIAKDLPDDQAVLAVLPGQRLSYLLIFTSDLGGTTFGIPPGPILHGKAVDTAKALKGGGLADVVQASHELFKTLFDERALEDIQGRRRLSMIWPDELMAIPPAMYVSVRPTGPGPVAWLLRDHDVALMPYVTEEPLVTTEGASPWLEIGGATLDAPALGLARERTASVYGESVLGSESPRRSGAAADTSRVGAAATVAALAQAVGQDGLVELSTPAFGGGRLGGLFLGPDPDAPRGDARAGFLPWHRLAELPGRASLILSRTRFDPSDTRYGAAYAATAAFDGGATRLVLTRWPMPSSIRDGMLGLVEQGWAATNDLVGLVNQAQRLVVASAERAGQLDRTHPRMWAGWLPSDAGP